MKKVVDAVVVGAGVIGASIAFHLTRLGMRNIALVDRGAVCSGATSRSGALVRTHYSNMPEAALAQASLPWFQNWAERVGGDCGFVQTGFVQLVLPEDHDKLKRNVQRLQAIGVATSVVSAAELRELQPHWQLADDCLVAYEPYSGYADPVATTTSLVHAAQRQGASIMEQCLVTGLCIEQGRVTGVETSSGVIHAPVVVLANGGWSLPLLSAFDIHLPITMARVQLAFFERPGELGRGPAGHLTCIDRANGIYCRPDADGATLVGLSAYRNPVPDPDSYELAADPDFVDLAKLYGARRIPGLERQRYLSGRAGVLDITPDAKAILDQAPGIDGLFLALGMSGSGFKKAPAIGACMAEMILTGESQAVSLEPFRLARFEETVAATDENYSLPADLQNDQVRGYLN